MKNIIPKKKSAQKGKVHRNFNRQQKSVLNWINHLMFRLGYLHFTLCIMLLGTEASMAAVGVGKKFKIIIISSQQIINLIIMQQRYMF